MIEGGSSGFAALLGGWRSSYRLYSGQGVTGHYWSGTLHNPSDVWYYFFYNGELERGSHRTDVARSVRCLQD